MAAHLSLVKLTEAHPCAWAISACHELNGNGGAEQGVVVASGTEQGKVNDPLT